MANLLLLGSSSTFLFKFVAAVAQCYKPVFFSATRPAAASLRADLKCHSLSPIRSPPGPSSSSSRVSPVRTGSVIIPSRSIDSNTTRGVLFKASLLFVAVRVTVVNSLSLALRCCRSRSCSHQWPGHVAVTVARCHL
jgi:hypothetical protein